MAEQPDKNMCRREFIGRIGKAGISVAVAGVVSYLAYDGRGPAAHLETKNLVTLPDFSIKPQVGDIMSIVKGRDRVKNLNIALKSLGGIGRFIKKGDVVAIKPNIAFSSPAILGATSHPDVIAEMVRLCLVEGQAKEVIVTDNPINDPQSCFMISGIGKAVEKVGGKIVMPKNNFFRNTTVANGKIIRNWPILFEPFVKVDKLIGIAPVKNHRCSGASMTMKNWYGLLGGKRGIFHQDINGTIAELAMMVKPTLVILDGTEVMMTNGPTGGSVSDLRRGDTMIVSCDMVAADSYGCGLLDMKIADLPYLSMAEIAGAGTTNWESLKTKMETSG